MPAPTRFWEATHGRVFVGRLETGSDLVAEIERFCLEREIVAAVVDVVGALRVARYAFYDPQAREYREVGTEPDQHEMIGFVGNISLRDNRPFLHAHATFSTFDGPTIGGHLVAGCEVFVAEVVIRELDDVSLLRVHDETTGLALW